MHFQRVSKLSWKKLEAVCEFEGKHLNRPLRGFPARDGPFRYCKNWIRCYAPYHQHRRHLPPPPVIWQYWQHDRDLLEYLTNDQQRLDKTSQVCRNSKRAESLVKNVVLFEGVGIKIPPAQASFIPTHPFFKKNIYTLSLLYTLLFFHFSLYLYIICSQYLLVCGVFVGSGCVCVCVWKCH